MGTPGEAAPVKYFVALLYPDEGLLDSVERDLTDLLGAIDLRSGAFPWSVSRYYENEMGRVLNRRFISFDPLMSPGRLADIKLRTGRAEARYLWRDGERTGRRINIDPGYLEAGKVVLASTKNASHRIYLRDGIYAEATLLYFDGAFHSCPYTYPDYLWPDTLAFFSRLRSVYLERRRSGLAR